MEKRTVRRREPLLKREDALRPSSQVTAPHLREKRHGNEWWSPEKRDRSASRSQLAVSALGMYTMISHSMTPILMNSAATAGAGAGLAALVASDDVVAQATKGDKGDTGDKGEKGDTGAAGTAGTAGTAGDKGEKGDTGAAGATGAAGTAGDKGEKGDDGVTGPKGDPGQKGEVGQKGAEGAEGVTGPKGDQGVTGAKGDQGDTGPKGDQGDTGEKGDPGQKGEVGEKGEVGATGTAGTAGVKGDPGEKGEAGTAGATGATGATGTAGAQGDKGEKGIAGAAADKGEKGEVGATGATGQGRGFVPIDAAQVKSVVEDLKRSGNADHVRVGELLSQLLSELETSPSGSAGQSSDSDSRALLKYAADPNSDERLRSAAVMGSISANEREIRALNAKYRVLRSENREGTAIALALGGMQLPLDRDNAVSMRFGNFEGESALAAAGAFRINENWRADFGVAYGLRHNQLGYSGGVTFSW